MSFDWIPSLAALLADNGDSLTAAIEWGLPIAIALLLVGFGLIFAEVFIPSGGALSIMAAIFVLGSIVAAFFDGLLVGLIFLTVVILMTPLVIVMVFKVFPYTAIGRRMINRGDSATPTERRAVVHEDKALLGQVGVTVTPLHPGGQADIAGEWRDVVTQNGESLDVGHPVQVVDVSGNRIVVRPVQPTQ